MANQHPQRAAVSKILRKLQHNNFTVDMIDDGEKYNYILDESRAAARMTAGDVITSVDNSQVKVIHDSMGVADLTFILGNGDDEIVADWVCQSEELDELIESIVFD